MVARQGRSGHGSPGAEGWALLAVLRAGVGGRALACHPRFAASRRGTGRARVRTQSRGRVCAPKAGNYRHAAGTAESTRGSGGVWKRVGRPSSFAGTPGPGAAAGESGPQFLTLLRFTASCFLCVRLPQALPVCRPLPLLPPAARPAREFSTSVVRLPTPGFPGGSPRQCLSLVVLTVPSLRCVSSPPRPVPVKTLNPGCPVAFDGALGHQSRCRMRSDSSSGASVAPGCPHRPRPVSPLSWPGFYP